LVRVNPLETKLVLWLALGIAIALGVLWFATRPAHPKPLSGLIVPSYLGSCES
jgi:hypothetical protein